MSGVVDVGDAIELTFSTTTEALVTMAWLDPDQVTVGDVEEVDETPPGSGLFPVTLLPTRPGVWTALFTASGAAVAVERYYIRATDATGPPPLATVADVTAQFGTLTPAQEGLVSWLLRVASKLVRFRVPQIDVHLAAGLLDPDVVALAVANMILRILRNPGGLRAETVGPFSRTYDTGTAAGLLVITDEELGMFTPGGSVTAAVAIGTMRVKAGMAPRPGWRGRVGRW